MKGKALILTLAVLAILTQSFILEDQQGSASGSKFRFKAFLGCSSDTSFVNKERFDQLAVLPLCAKDSNNTVFKIVSFDITYAERGLYQDSTGLPIVFTDYSNVSCTGDTIPSRWINIFKERGYRVDTIMFDRILVRTSENKTQMCKAMRVILR